MVGGRISKHNSHIDVSVVLSSENLFIAFRPILFLSDRLHNSVLFFQIRPADSNGFSFSKILRLWAIGYKIVTRPPPQCIYASARHITRLVSRTYLTIRRTNQTQLHQVFIIIVENSIYPTRALTKQSSGTRIHTCLTPKMAAPPNQGFDTSVSPLPFSTLSNLSTPSTFMTIY